MKKKTKTITVGFQSFKIIKELENTIIVEKDGKRYVYHKKKKIIVTPNYDAKPIIKVAEIKARTGRANNDSYSLIRHQKLSERVQKIMDKRKCYRFEIAGEIGFSTATLATFLKNKKVNGSSLDVVESWLEKNE
nr:MAG TPA: repressor regulating protein [Caudoviricetes sp.]